MLQVLKSISSRMNTSRGVFFLLILSAVVLGTICFVNALQWINQPFPGFLVAPRMVVNGVGQYHWTGTQAGLKFPDKLLTANNLKMSTSKEFYESAENTPIGTPIQYTFERSGRTLSLTIPTMRFSVSDFVIVVGGFFLAGAIYLILGVIVFVLKPDTPTSWSFLFLCLLLSTFNFINFDVGTNGRFLRWYMFFITFIPAAITHLSMLFPNPSRIVQRYPAVQLVPYVVSTLIVIPLELFYPGPTFLAAQKFVYLYLVVGALALLSSTLISYIWQTSVIARQRAIVVLFGAAVGFLAPGLGELAMFMGSTFKGIQGQANYLVLPLTLFPAAIGYAIAKHNLFDVDVYIKRTVGYVLMTTIVLGGYFVLQTVVKAVVLDPLFGSASERVYPLLFALLTVLAFNPISRKVQEFVDKLFFRKQYDYKATVAAVSDAVTSVVDLNDIIRSVIGTVRKQMFVDTAGVVLLDDRKKECRALFAADVPNSIAQERQDLCLSYDDPLLALLAREKKLITKYDIAEDPQYAEVKESCGERFAAMGATLAFPLFYREEFTGVLALGYKKSGHFYSREDIDLLKTVSTITSSAIEQAREKGQKAVLMQLFSKHVSPEVAEAVWQQREQFLEGGRPRSQKLMATVLFTDLKGFSTVSEKMDPQSLMDWLNSYMDTMAKIVMEHGGVVDDYFGDAIKANFGVPLPRTSEAEIRRDAVNAVDCALAMEKEMVRLNTRMYEQSLPTLKMRVGIYTGDVVAGSLGSADRLKYTTIGDTVNTASRLESFDKDLVLPHLETSPCRVLIGQSTLDYLGDQFLTLRVGELSLKGKDEKIAAYGVIGRATEKTVHTVGKTSN